MKGAHELNSMTAEQKVNYFADAFKAHYAEYAAEVDPRTGECDFSFSFIFDVFLTDARTRYGRENERHAINGARIASDGLAVLRTFKHKGFTKRDHETTNVVACQSVDAPGEEWEIAPESVLNGLTMLWRQGDVRYYGYL